MESKVTLLHTQRTLAASHLTDSSMNKEDCEHMASTAATQHLDLSPVDDKVVMQVLEALQHLEDDALHLQGVGRA